MQGTVAGYPVDNLRISGPRYPRDIISHKSNLLPIYLLFTLNYVYTLLKSKVLLFFPSLPSFLLPLHFCSLSSLFFFWQVYIGLRHVCTNNLLKNRRIPLVERFA